MKKKMLSIFLILLISALEAFTIVEVLVPVKIINRIDILYTSATVYLLVVISNFLFLRFFLGMIRKSFNKIIILFLSILILLLLIVPLNNFQNLQKTSLKITALGQKNTSSKSTEVWLNRIIIDNKSIDLTNVKYFTDGWTIKYDILGSFGNQPSYINLNLYSRKNIDIELLKHDYSGKAILQINNSERDLDLFSQKNDALNIKLEESGKIWLSIYNFIVTYSYLFFILCSISFLVVTDKKYHRKQFKRWAISSVSTFLIIILLFSVLVYIVDPLQFYHRSNKSMYYKQERFQKPGLIKNFDYDTAIIGSSMTQNFVPSEIDSLLGGKSIKLSLSGASSRELFYLTNLALNQKNIKRIIYGIDMDSIMSDANYTQTVDKFPIYLYDKNSFNDLHYLLNKKFIVDAWEQLIAFSYNDGYVPLDLDKMDSWGQWVTYGKERVLADYQQNYQGKKLDNSIIKTNATENLESNIIKLVESNPNTKFVFFYSPYSIVYFSHFENSTPNFLDSLKEIKVHFYEELKKYNNVELYDFSSVVEITADLNNYKDVIHYSDKINSYIIKKISQKQDMVTGDNLITNIDKFNSQVTKFNIK